jgi:single-strand DNA-binding protein
MDSSITIIGSLGRDPELVFTAKGGALCSFTVATSRRYKQNDEWVEKTAWVDVTAFGTLAENIAASITKGCRVIVTGTVDQDEWEDKETGKKRTKLKILADGVGAELRWARVEIEKVERERSGG